MKPLDCSSQQVVSFSATHVHMATSYINLTNLSITSMLIMYPTQLIIFAFQILCVGRCPTITGDE